MGTSLLNSISHYILSIINAVYNFIITHAALSKIVYGVIAACFVVCYSLFAIYIFIERTEIYRKKNQSRWWMLHQIWVNALGQSIGWFMGYYVIRKLLLCGIDTFEIGDYIRSVIVFAGVTGYLPTILSRWQPRA